MSNKIAIIIPSREDIKQKEDFINHIKETCGASAQIIFLINSGGASLTTIYQEVLDNKDIDADIFIFMHDDVEFLRPGWGAEIIRLFNEHQDYGIIGVAGSAEFDSDAAWWRYKNIYGQVLHRSEGKSWLTAFSPLLDKDLEEVCVIDGIFMAVYRNRISKGFDTDFGGFNHYDTSFCLANFFDKKTKIGVTTNIRMAHNSVGEMKPNWYENRDKLNEKYKDKFPIKL